MIKYSENFKARVRALYGDTMDQHLESGNEILGRMLDDSSESKMSISTILAATSLEELQAKARKTQAKIDLYNDYWTERNANSTPQPHY